MVILKVNMKCASKFFFAKALKCSNVMAIFNKYDLLLKQAANANEKYQIGIAGVTELHKLFSCKGALIVNNQIVLPSYAQPSISDLLKSSRG
jgi:hypothetical protein